MLSIFEIIELRRMKALNSEALEKGKKIGYNKAIDDFKKILTIEKIKEYSESDGFINLNNCSLMIFDIVEQLKVGEQNEIK